MSVASNNPFQLLGDDGAAPAPAAAPAAAEKPQRHVPGAPRRDGLVDDAPLPREPHGTHRDRTTRDRASRGGNARGRGRGRGGSRGRGRAFDRHSGTGHEDTAKAIRAGWGGNDAESEMRDEEGAKVDAKNQAAEDAAQDARDAEAEDKTLTLDQYLVAQTEKRQALNASTSNAAPRETVDADESTYGQKLEKNKDDGYFGGVATKKTTAPKPKKEKQTIEFEPVYAAPTQPRRSEGRGGSRGGRGAPRGHGAPRGRGDARRGAPRGRSGPAVNLNDESAFPSLT